MKQRRENRNLCAELLTIRWTDGAGDTRNEVGTLEDISETGACLHLENSIPLGSVVTLLYPEGEYLGKIKYCIYQEIGFVLGIEFDEGYRWSKSDFQPAHLLELPPAKKKSTVM